MKSDRYGVLDGQKSKPWEGGPSFSLRHRLLRVLWKLTWFCLASWTPPFMYRWRRFLLVCFGANMALRSDVRGTAKVWYPANLTIGDHGIIAGGVNCYNMGPVVIGDWTVVSQGAFLCGGTHDFSDPDRQLIARPIIIEDHCWVASEAFIGPGVTMKQGAILGARAVAFRDLEPWTIYVGNPASVLKKRPQPKKEN